MSIKTSQAILKCFIDLKSSVWFTLGSEDETVFCDTWKGLLELIGKYEKGIEVLRFKSSQLPFLLKWLKF